MFVTGFEPVSMCTAPACADALRVWHARRRTLRKFIRLQLVKIDPSRFRENSL